MLPLVISGFFSSSKARLACKMAQSCGVYLSLSFKTVTKLLKKRLAFAGLTRTVRFGLTCNLGMLHLFVLNRARILKQTSWLVNDTNRLLKAW
ncbi:MAG: hypothetical protein ACKERG_02340 [Candidatus Hodgkinia cicadicola]